MPGAEAKKEPIQQSTHVDCEIEDAFRLFTEGFGDWWPLASYSTNPGESEFCVMEPWIGGRIFERTVSGEEREWGSIVEWDPPQHVRFTWHPATVGNGASTVDVEFHVEADGTRVTLIHSSWEAPGVAVNALRAECSELWRTALQDCFPQFVSAELLVLA
jgi:uncharacterized protein YndB with AHSA1/START domain